MMKNHRRNMWVAIILAVVFILVIMGMSGGRVRLWGKMVRIKDVRLLMDTSVAITLYSKSEDEGKKALEEAFRLMEKIDRIMSISSPVGDVVCVNNRNPGEQVKVSKEFSTIFKHCQYYSRLTGGMYDASIGTVNSLWDFNASNPQVPDSSSLKKALENVGYTFLIMKKGELFIQNDDLKVDFGGAAKGYAIDRVIEHLKYLGIPAALVDAGGDLRFYGKKPGGEDWVIAVRHPRKNGHIIPEHKSNNSVATSGDYERYFIQNGIRYHHILDPRTGHPARGCVSVTIWAQTALDADILATAVFVMGPEKGLSLIESLPGIETLIYCEQDSREGIISFSSSGVKELLKN